MSIYLQIIASVLAGFCIMLSMLLFARLRWPAPFLWFLKLYVSALSPLMVFIGLLCMIAGVATGSWLTSILGLSCTFIFIIHIFKVSRPPVVADGFDHAFGRGWEKLIAAAQTKHLLPSRLFLKLPSQPPAPWEKDIAFATVPGTERKILCDVWQPPPGVSPSGLAFIYLHGAAWYFLDKDLGTRPFFSHLASQGHVIMDVAYRLAPETDMMGMVHDVKHAITWMKEHADVYGIDPGKIGAGGSSSGAHLAMLAAYTDGNPAFTPADLAGKDSSVCGVISMYGPAELEPMYYHTRQHLTTRPMPGKIKKAVPTGLPQWIIKKMGSDYHRLHMDKGFVNAGTFAPLMGGHPDECPEQYARFSPINYVHPNCPPTLLIHGEHDLMAPVASTRKLYSRLLKEKVPAILHIIPQADHAFDLIIPALSPAAHNAIYDVEHFLAIMASKKQGVERAMSHRLQKQSNRQE